MSEVTDTPPEILRMVREKIMARETRELTRIFLNVPF